MSERRKVYVDVLARHEKYGKTTPISITFEDGKTYPIDVALIVADEYV